jgi:flagellar FliL protein
MAEEKEKKEEAAPASAPAAGGASMLLKVGLGVSILFGIAGFATAGVVMAKKKAADAEAAAVEEVASDAAEGHGEDAATEVSAEDELEEGEQVIGAIFPLDTFVINLNGGKYLRAQVRLEFEGRDVPKRFYPRIVPVRDELLGILSSKRAEDLLTSQGKDNLKKEIKDSINELLRKEDVKNVYFTQFVVQ